MCVCIPSGLGYPCLLQEEIKRLIAVALEIFESDTTIVPSYLLANTDYPLPLRVYVRSGISLSISTDHSPKVSNAIVLTL